MSVEFSPKILDIIEQQRFSQQIPREDTPPCVPLLIDGKEIIPKRHVERQNFGPGNAGESAFKVMQTVEGCERIADWDSREKCGQEPLFVLDFDDAFREVNHLALCSQECMEDVMNTLSEQRIGMAGIGINGFGRH